MPFLWIYPFNLRIFILTAIPPCFGLYAYTLVVFDTHGHRAKQKKTWRPVRKVYLLPLNSTVPHTLPSQGLPPPSSYRSDLFLSPPVICPLTGFTHKPSGPQVSLTLLSPATRHKNCATFTRQTIPRYSLKPKIWPWVSIRSSKPRLTDCQ